MHESLSTLHRSYTIKEPAALSECETALIFLNTCQIAHLLIVEWVYKCERFQKALVYIRRKLGVAYEAVVLPVHSTSHQTQL